MLRIIKFSSLQPTTVIRKNLVWLETKTARQLLQQTTHLRKKADLSFSTVATSQTTSTGHKLAGALVVAVMADQTDDCASPRLLRSAF